MGPPATTPIHDKNTGSQSRNQLTDTPHGAKPLRDTCAHAPPKLEQDRAPSFKLRTNTIMESTNDWRITPTTVEEAKRHMTSQHPNSWTIYHHCRSRTTTDVKHIRVHTIKFWIYRGSSSRDTCARCFPLSR